MYVGKTRKTVSVFVFIFGELDKYPELESETSPYNNLMMRRAGLSRICNFFVIADKTRVRLYIQGGEVAEGGRCWVNQEGQKLVSRDEPSAV